VARRLIVPLCILAALAPAAGAEAKQLTRYVVGGGLAGRVDTVVIQTNGNAHQSGDGGEHRWKLSSKRLRALKSAFKAARWSSLKREYRPKFPVNDGTTQTVTYRGKQITIATGGEPPRRLERVIARIRRVMRT
jgi:hypothetical protein